MKRFFYIYRRNVPIVEAIIVIKIALKLVLQRAMRDFIFNLCDKHNKFFSPNSEKKRKVEMLRNTKILRRTQWREKDKKYKSNRGFLCRTKLTLRRSASGI